jgi:hypothetical protein
MQKETIQPAQMNVAEKSDQALFTKRPLSDTPPKESTRKLSIPDSPSNSTSISSSASPLQPQLDKEQREQLRHARALNLAIESIFNITMRKDNSSDNLSYVGNLSSSECLLNTTNISEAICSKLSDDNSNELCVGGAVGYLAACYKRLQNKESSSTSAQMTEDLSK